jgi:putative transposase
MTYNAVNYAQERGIDNRKGMKEFYRSLKDVNLPSCYKTAAIGRACAVIQSRKKSQKRGVEVNHRKPLRSVVCITSGFFITMKGRLFIPLRRDKYFDVQLNQHVLEVLEGKKKVRSLTITSDALSFCYSEDIKSLRVKKVYGVDRNEKNMTFGDKEGVIQIDMERAVKIRQTTREIIGSLKRNDVRVRKQLASKYWSRANHRTDQMLHAATNFIIETTSRNGAALALEDLTDIRKMYRRGDGQGADYRFRLNSWPHWKTKRVLEYKALWKGVSVIQLTKSDTYGSSSECSACGEKLHNPAKDDSEHRRMLWCETCKVWINRDVNAALNLSKRGLARFTSSRRKSKSRSQQTDLAVREKGLVGEAVKGNPMRTTVILRVDASKLSGGYHRWLTPSSVSGQLNRTRAIILTDKERLGSDDRPLTQEALPLRPRRGLPQGEGGPGQDRRDKGSRENQVPGEDAPGDNKQLYRHGPDGTEAPQCPGDRGGEGRDPDEREDDRRVHSGEVPRGDLLPGGRARLRGGA